MDLAAVASGFLLRAIAGGAASGIYLSPWFLLVASFGSLFMVAGKRYSEIHAIGAEAGTRRSLEFYSESYMRFVWGMAASVTVVASVRPGLEKPRRDVLTFEVPADIAMDSYPGAYGQVLTNLIFNAFTHAFANRPDGHVTISARRFGSDQVAGNLAAFQSLFFIGALLFVMTLGLNVLGDKLVNRVREVY